MLYLFRITRIIFNHQQEAAKVIQPKVSKKLKKSQRPPQPSSTVTASQPKCDENENFYILKSELDDELNLKPGACLWRRDGHELQQKYELLPAGDGPEEGIFFEASPVYAIWEELRRNEYHAVEVKHAKSSNDSKLQLVAIVVQQDVEEHQTVIELEDSLISFDDGSSDGPLDENCIIIEEIFVNEA